MSHALISTATAMLALANPCWAEPPSAPAPVPAAPSAPGPVPASVVVPVAVETLVIEEKSLLPMPALDMGSVNLQLDGHGDGWIASGDRQDHPNAMRLYGFTLEPGERLLLKLKSENSSKMWMRFAPPPAKDPMTSEVKAANRSPKQTRAVRLTLKNVTQAPYQIIAMLYGEAGLAYRMEIQRSR